MIGLLLASALILGAQAFIVGSSRTVFQMSRDGYLPRAFAAVNRRQVPIGSLALDGAVILGCCSSSAPKSSKWSPPPTSATWSSS